MNKRDEQRRQADRDFEEIRQAIANLSDAELCETLRDVPHRKWLEIEKDTHMAVGIVAHRAADLLEEKDARIAELERENQSMRADWKAICDAAESMPAGTVEFQLRQRIAELEKTLQAISIVEFNGSCCGCSGDWSLDECHRLAKEALGL